MEKHQCFAMVRIPGGWHSFDCQINASYFEEEKWWCPKHAPSKVKERQIKRDEKWKKEREKSLERSRKYKYNEYMNLLFFLRDTGLIKLPPIGIKETVQKIIEKTIPH